MFLLITYASQCILYVYVLSLLYYANTPYGSIFSIGMVLISSVYFYIENDLKLIVYEMNKKNYRSIIKSEMIINIFGTYLDFFNIRKFSVSSCIIKDPLEMLLLLNI